MRGNTENRAENYIKRHQKYKKWLAFALCVSLFTGTVTLYMLNKPATAMTEEGAESLGLVLETADDDFEQGLIEQMNDADQDGGGETFDDEYASEGSGSGDENGSEGASGWENYSDTGDSSASDKDYEASDDSSTASLSEDESLAAASESSLDEASKEAASAASSFSSKKTSLEVPDSVDLAKYITETVIERLNDAGEWEQISKSDIRPADKLRITFNYVLPKEAVASDDIYLDIPEEFGTAIAAEEELDDGKGSYEVTEDNQLKIQYSDEVKEEIISDAEEDDLQASLSLPRALGAFFNLFTLTVYADDSVSGSVTVQTVVDSTTDGSMTVTGVKVTKNPTTTWVNGVKTYSGGTEIADGSEVLSGEYLLFTLSYKLATGTIDAENNVITYSLANHGIDPAESISGIVYNNSNQAVGSFVVDEDGLVTITFNESFADKNETQVVYGTFYFVAQAESDSSEETETKVYDFGDNVTFTVIINNSKDSDLSLSKEASEYDESTGTIKYTIRAKSVNGTSTDIELSDLMEVYYNTNTNTNKNTALTEKVSFADVTDLSVVLKDSSGNKTTISPSELTYDANSMTLTLPALEAGKYYKITYTYKVPEEISGSSDAVKLKNTISAYYDSKDATPAKCHTKFDGDKPDIQKEGSADTTNHKVTWTITLNSEHNNLKGYTLSDIMHTLDTDGYSDIETAYTGKITVKSVTKADGETYSALSAGDEITIAADGYTFSDSVDDYSTYVFTYTYTYSSLDLVYGSLKNEAKIYLETPDDGNSSTGKVWIGDPKFVEKEAGGISANSDGTYAITWNVTILAPIAPNEGTDNSEYWTFYEYIRDDNELFTEDDVTAFTEAIKSVYSGSFEVFKEKSRKVGNISGYKRLYVRFYDELTEDISFSFSATGYIGDGTDKVTFINKVYVYNDTYSVKATQDYEPVIQKFDGNNNSGNTTYDYYTDALYKQGILTWNIKVIVPASNSYDTLYVTDSLPDNVSLIDNGTYNGTYLYGLEVAGDDSFNSAVGFENGSATYNGVTYTETVSGNDVKVSFNAQSAAGQTIYLKIRAKISADFDFTSVTKGEFENSVILSTDENGDSKLGFDSQTQYVTKTETAMSKKSSAVVDSINTVEYILDINSNAADLLTDGDELTLTDTLTATAQSEFTAQLVTGSVVVYEVTTDSDGNEILTELSTDKYSYSSSSYSTTTSYWQNYSEYCTIVFKIPDGKHLKIKYQYMFEGTKGVTVSISNKAELQGIVIENNSAKDSTEVKIEEAGAKADVQGINLYKVDNDNNAIFLEGAEFYLYYWDYDNSVWVQQLNADTTDGRYVSDSNGLVAVGNLIYNLAYKIVEVTAPKGYVLKQTPLHFYVPSTELDKYPLKLPDNFFKELDGTAIAAGADVKFTNEKETTSITVNKEWVNEDSTQPDSITVKIGRRLGSETTEASTTFHTVHVDRRNGGNVITQYIGYPSVKDGSQFTFIFYTYKDQYNDYRSRVYINGEELDYSADLTDGGYQKISKTIAITGDTTIKIVDNSSDLVSDVAKYPVTCSVVSASGSSVSGLEDDLQDDDYKTITLTAADDWTYTLDDLDRYYFVKDDAGNVVDRYVWNYYVSEVNNVYYTATYTENNKAGINSGTITITNTRNDIEPYSLPKTGGIGEEPLKAAGFGFMGIALAGTAFTCVRRRKKSLLPKSR